MNNARYTIYTHNNYNLSSSNLYQYLGGEEMNRGEIMTKIRAHHIKKGLADKHADEFFMTEVKNGPTWSARKGELLRLDGLAIKKSWTKPCITGYEVKVSRNDFLNDEKWPAYMEYCHRFYFACPKGLIQPEELPDDVGLLWYSPDYNNAGNLYTRRKALYRNIEISQEMLYYIIICRLESDRHPFFSSQREQYQMWVEDKIDRLKLGWRVSNKMLEEINELEKAKNKAESIANKYKNASETLDKIKKLLRDSGVDVYAIGRPYSSWEEDLKKALSIGVDKIGLRLVERIEADARELGRIING